MNHKPRQKKVIFSILSAMLIVACMCSPASLLPANTPPPEVSAPKTEPTPAEFSPTQTDAPPAEAFIPSPTVSEAQGLQAEVPWLIISTDDALWAANMDGSNLVKLTDKTTSEIDLQRAVSSTAHKIAVLTTVQDAYHMLSLLIISLPEGNVIQRINLTTPDTEPSLDASPGESSLEAMRAVAEQPSFTWSPDGRRLAFTAALDSPNADIYVYDLQSQEIRKVSDDEGQDYLPTWSPDGKSILFLEAEGFGTGAGFAMSGIWLAAADGSSTRKLATPTSSGEQLIGWRDDETVVLTSWSPAFGPSQLRLYNIRTQKQTILVDGAVSGAAVASGIEADSGAVLYGTENGLFVLPPAATAPQKLSDELVSSYGYPAAIRWQEDGRIFIVHFEDGVIATYMADGSQRTDPPFNLSGGTLDVSSFGLIWGWTNKGAENEGAWISGPGMTDAQVWSGPASNPMWNVDNDLLFFVGQDLYKATFNSYYSDATMVGSLTGNVRDMAWMGFNEALDKKYSQ
jgi:WD40 repeat protein